MKSDGGTRAQLRLALLAVALLALGGALTAYLLGRPDPRLPLSLPAAAVAALFLVAELGRLHIDIRRSAITVTLSDVALIVALFTVQPGEAVLLRLTVCVPVLLWLYRRSPNRIAVNTGNMVFESAACALVFTHFAGGDPTSLLSWLAAMAAVQASGLLAGLVVNMAIKFNGDTETVREIVGGLVVGAAVSATTGTLGIFCVAVTASSGSGRWLLLAAIVIGLLVYRGYARLLERKEALEAVHGFSRALDTDSGMHALLHTILESVPAVVGAARVEMVLHGEDGAPHMRARLADGGVRLERVTELDWPVQQVLESGNALVLGRHSRQRSAREVLRSGSMRELMVAPVPTEMGAGGVLVAIDRLGQARGFRRGDLILFETLCLHAGVALSNVELVDQLRHDVEHDRLTGLLNRQGVTDVVDATETPVGFVLLQLGGLQDVNDALGHPAGDALLAAVATRLRGALRAGSALGRMDDKVFAAVLPRADIDTATTFAERLMRSVTEPIEIDGVPIALGATAGLALSDGEGDVLRQAEIALRAAHGKDGALRVFEAGMAPPSARRLSTAAELRHVLDDPHLARQVTPYYQPKVDMRTGRVSAVEALVRWHHPERGLIPPGDFIPVVESTGLIRPLTLHVLNRALADAVRWRDAGNPLTVSVNLSARSLHDARLVDDVMTTIRAHGADPELLTLEITESAVMDDADRARDLLEELSALGISLSVDDFGTGYSSLAYLARLPIHEVKVDRMFVSRMTQDTRDAAVVRSVVELGHSLNLQVVAEGVEDDACWDALLNADVDVAQGFLVSRPVPVAELEKWLAERQAKLSSELAS